MVTIIVSWLITGTIPMISTLASAIALTTALPGFGASFDSAHLKGGLEEATAQSTEKLTATGDQ